MVELAIRIEQSQSEISLRKLKILSVLLKVSEIIVSLAILGILAAFSVECILMYRAAPR